jgi:hypothetical protein
MKNFLAITMKIKRKDRNQKVERLYLEIEANQK